MPCEAQSVSAMLVLTVTTTRLPSTLNESEASSKSTSRSLQTVSRDDQSDRQKLILGHQRRTQLEGRCQRGTYERPLFDAWSARETSGEYPFSTRVEEMRCAVLCFAVLVHTRKRKT